MKNPHKERGTTYTSERHRPGHEPAVAANKVPERAVEGSQRAAAATTLSPEIYGGGFKPSPQREAEDRVGAVKRD